MKRVLACIAIVVLLVACMGSAMAQTGPAPSSGDGVSEGSGMDSRNGAMGDGASDDANGLDGPAPNSGDGVPDGSGMDSPGESG